MPKKQLIITDKMKTEMFHALKEKTSLEVGYDFGMNYSYADNTVKQKMTNIKKEVIANPEKFGITDKDIAEVEKASNKRWLEGNEHSHRKPVPNDLSVLKKKEFNELIFSASSKAMLAVHKKLNEILQDDAQLSKTSLTQLTTAAGILFDKRQISKGEATQNIAIKAKIDKDLTPEAKLDLILKMRELNS